MRVLVSGAGGLIGRALGRSLAAGGHAVARLVRRPPRAPEEFHWDPSEGRIDPAACSGCDAVVHLAGESIAAGRWTARRRAAILSSRRDGTRVLATAVADARPVPHTLLCASAVGIYGDRGDDPLDESSPPGTGYLADVARAWESEAGPARAAGARVAHLRFGIVLAREGGALPPMALACRLGLGGSIGTGRHWMSWITLEDTLNAIGFALAHGGMRGPVNVVSPQPVRQADLSRALSRVLRRPDLLRVPAWLIGAVLGEMGRELLLASQRVEPARLVASGFTFRHPSIDAALRSVLQETARD